MATDPAHNSPEAAAARLRAALEMFETGVEMKRQTIRRNHPDLTEPEVDARVRAWLAERPGAPFGDAVGRPVPWPRRAE
jgi:signal transduction histidine kinase